LLVPVTPTLNVPVEENVQDNVAPPEPVTLVGPTEHEVLLVDKLTTPENPFSEVTVILDAPEVLALTVSLDGLAVREKSRAKVTW
jgi:hypothetical protein